MTDMDNLIKAVVEYASRVGWVVAIANQRNKEDSIPGIIMGTKEYVSELLGESAAFDSSILN